MAINNPIDSENPVYGTGNWAYEGNLRFNGTPGVSYSVEITPVDWAGNASASEDVGVSGRSLVFDGTAPVLDVAFGPGLYTSGGTKYLTDTSDLVIDVTAVDDETGVVSIEYTFEDIDNEIITGWVDTVTALRAEYLEDGTRYRVLVRAVNGTGRNTTTSTGSFMYDESGPENLSMEFLSADSGLIPGENLRVRLTAEDTESGIAEYSIAVGSTAGGTDVSEQVNGNVSGRLVTSMGSEGLFSFAVPDIADGTYYITAEAVNGSGLTEPASGFYTAGSFTVNRGAEKIAVSEPWLF